MSTARVVNCLRVGDFGEAGAVGTDAPPAGLPRMVTGPNKRVTRGLTGSIGKHTADEATGTAAATTDSAAGQQPPCRQPGQGRGRQQLQDVPGLELGLLSGVRQATTTGVCLPVIGLDTSGDMSREDDVVSRERCSALLPTIPRSKKTTKLKVNNPPPSDLHAPRPYDGTSSQTNLAIEGQDLKLPPPRTPTGPRRQLEKSIHRLNTGTAVRDLGLLVGDDIQSLEDSLKALLLCQSIGIVIQITKPRDPAEDSGGLARPVFHCQRCLRHWTVFGRPPLDCREPEDRVSGPSFSINRRNHEIFQKFAQLSPVDKQSVLDAIQASVAQTSLSPCHNGGMVSDSDVMDSLGLIAVSSPDLTSSRHRASEPAATEEESAQGARPSCHQPGHKPDDTKATAPKDAPLVRQHLRAAGGGQEHLTKSVGLTCETEERKDPIIPTEDSITGRTKILGQAPSNSDQSTYWYDPGRSTVTYVVSARGTFEEEDDKPVEKVAPQISQRHVEADGGVPGTDHQPSARSPDGSRTGAGTLGETGERSLADDEAGEIPRRTSHQADERVAMPASIHSPAPPGFEDGPLAETGGDSYRLFTDGARENPAEFSGHDSASEDDWGRQSDRDTTGEFSVPKVTVTMNGPGEQSHRSQTASFNNSAGAEVVEAGKGRSQDGTEDSGRGGCASTAASSWDHRGVGSAQRPHDHRDGGAVSEPTGSPRLAAGLEEPTARASHTSAKGSSAARRARNSSNVSYMGVKDHHEDEPGSASPQGSHHGDVSKGSKPAAAAHHTTAPIRNTAVRNVTGKPDTRPGNLERHMFATPRETLAQTNALNMVPKSSGEGLNPSAAKPRPEDVVGNVRQDSTSNIQSSSYLSPRRESLDADNSTATKLPPLNPTPRHLPPLGVHDPEKTQTKDRRRSLGQPRTDHPLPDLVDKRQEQKRNAAPAKKEKSKPAKRPPVTREGETESARRGPGLPSNLSKSKSSITDENDDGDYAEKPKARSKGEGLRSTENDKLLPATETAGGGKSTVDKMEDKMDKMDEHGRDTESPLMKTLLNQFDKFELSLSPPPSGSLPPVSTDKSYRMTYSTLPRTFDWDAPPARHAPAGSRGSLSPPLVTRHTPDGETDAKYGQSSAAVQPGTNGDVYYKSARRPARAPGVSPSISSGTSLASSPAESVWDSVSEVWRRHTAELQRLERLIALNFLPLTSAFTFSLFEIPPQYLAHNRLLREQAMQIRTLKKPKRITMKFATKSQREEATRRPLTRRPLKPVK